MTSMPKKGKQPAGVATSERRGGDIFPVPSSSTSCSGLAEGLPACPSVALVSAVSRGLPACLPTATASAWQMDVDLEDQVQDWSDEIEKWEERMEALDEEKGKRIGKDRLIALGKKHKDKVEAGPRPKCPPSGWFPTIFPPSRKSMKLQTEVAYRRWAWEWEGQVDKVERLVKKELLRTDQEWVTREVKWIEYAEVMEEKEEDFKRKEKECKGLTERVKSLEQEKKDWEKGKKEKGERSMGVNRDTGTQTDLGIFVEGFRPHIIGGATRDWETQTEEDLRPGAEPMDFDSDPGRRGIGDLESRLGGAMEAVSTLGKSLDSLGERFARELGGLRSEVRALKAGSVAAPSNGVERRPPLPAGRSAPVAGGSVGGGGRDSGKGKRRKGDSGLGAPPPQKRKTADAPASPAPAAVHPPVSRGHPAAGFGAPGVSAPSPSSQTAAVLIRAKVEEGFSVAEALRRVRGVPLPEGTVGSSVRRSANGGLLVEARGPRGGEAADDLAGRLAPLLPEASVRRAERYRGVGLIRFDDSALPEELVGALAGCAACETSRVRIGALRWGPSGRGFAWARLPLAAIGVGGFALGWSAVRIVRLGGRPLQCYRCWGYGHVKARCPGTGADRSRECFACGGDGHVARDCRAAPDCTLCRGSGQLSRHRMGSAACGAAERARGGRGDRARRRRGRPPNSAGARGGA